MRRALSLILIAVAMAGTLAIASAATAPTIITPADLSWTPVQGIPGASMATVWGDPSKSVPYIQRLKLDDGTKIPVHWHPQDERVTVLSGTLMVGTGDTMDAASMKALDAGSFVFIPQGLHHYAMAKGPTVVQISGMGPQTINLVK